MRDLLDRQAVAEGLGDHQDAVGRRPRQRADDGRLVGRALDLDLVEAGQAGLHRAQRLLQRFLEGPADRHRLAHALHRGGEQRLGAGELLEGEARHLGDDVVDRRLEGGRRVAGDVVQQLVERVADRQPRGDLGDREAGGLRGQRRGARDARVHLDHDHAAGRRIDGELHVRAAGIDPDLAQARDRGVAHDLVFLVGERQRRRDRHGVAGVDAHRIDVLDRADDDAVVLAVAHDLHLVLFPAEHGLLDQHFGRRRGFEAALHDVEELVAIVGDAAAGAAQGEGRADDRRQADLVERLRRLLAIVHDLALGRFEPDLGHGVAEQQAVLGLVDRLGIGADQLDAELGQPSVAMQRHRGVERGLAAHGRQDGVGPFLLDDLDDHVGRDRLDVGRVDQPRIGHDRGRVGVDQDDAIALVLQRLARLHARIVELAGLADDDRPGADDQDGLDVCTLGHGLIR